MEQFKGQSRLPKLVSPKRYDVRLKPDLAACEFAGSVSIDVDVVSETRFVVLNAAELTIRDGSVSFTSKASSQMHASDVSASQIFSESIYVSGTLKQSNEAGEDQCTLGSKHPEQRTSCPRLGRSWHKGSASILLLWLDA